VSSPSFDGERVELSLRDISERRILLTEVTVAVFPSGLDGLASPVAAGAFEESVEVSAVGCSVGVVFAVTSDVTDELSLVGVVEERSCDVAAEGTSPDGSVVAVKDAMDASVVAAATELASVVTAADEASLVTVADEASLVAAADGTSDDTALEAEDSNLHHVRKMTSNWMEAIHTFCNPEGAGENHSDSVRMS
jgi:hypothetical protein